MNENKKYLKRLTIELAPHDHQEIKRRAAEQGKSIKVWLIEAVKDKIEKEKHLGFE